MLRRTAPRARGSYGKVDRAGMVQAQRRALKMAQRSVASRHYAPPGPYPQGELKGMDTGVSTAAVLNTTGTNGDITVLNLIQTGTGSWNRIGRKTCLKSLRIQGRAECVHAVGATNDLLGNQLRIIIVWDKQPSGAALPAFDDIFAVTDQSGAETTTYASPLAFDTMDRFRVIKDWTLVSNPMAIASTAVAGTDTVQNEFDIDEFVTLPNLDSNYSGQSTPMTIADINTGALYVITRSLLNNAATSVWSYVCNHRIRYVD